VLIGIDVIGPFVAGDKEAALTAEVRDQAVPRGRASRAFGRLGRFAT
jgi:hypothetical protein